MKTNYLFPHRYKKLGWIILIPCVVFGFFTVITDYEPEFLDVQVFALFIDGFLGEDKIIGFTGNNILNEILGVLVICSGLLVAFSREKHEDEFISKIRLESLVWATYLNYGILVLAMLLFYDFTFLWVMIFNMFTILLFFIFKFNWSVWQLQKSLSYEEQH
ncbi:hypothetical protein [Salinimicrobium soli]|uniref:hypothetical protein n=1 Tax=Salinimicrobium soli TaxID=1254399 RepID=UPI003AAA37F5